MITGAEEFLSPAAIHGCPMAKELFLITPPGAVMLGWLLGGETFPLSSLLGAALVLVGVWMIFRKASVSEPLIQEG